VLGSVSSNKTAGKVRGGHWESW